MNNSYLLCYDLETGHLSPHIAEIIQIAGAIIEPNSLKIIDRFSSYMKPDFDAPGCSDDTISNFHAKQKGISKKAMYKILEDAPDTKIVWDNWVKWVHKYNMSKTNTPFKAPIRAGYNIINYDDVIIDRYCKRYGQWDEKKGAQTIFNQVNKIDMMDHVWYWFENNTEIENLKLSTVMEYMGYNATNAHEASVDVEMTCNLIIRFFNLQRHLTSFNKEGKRRLEMKDCMRN